MPSTNIAERVLRENDDFEDARPLVDVQGMSSPKVCNLLNKLVANMDEGEHYLEIGCYKGLTLVSAAYRNPGKTCMGCDKIRFWSRSTGEFWFQVKKELFDNIARYRAESAEIDFHHMKSQEFFRRRLAPKPVGVYFYDGDHSYEGTRSHVVAAADSLSKKSVLLMDDWNDPEIQRATADGMAEAGLEVLWKRELAGTNQDKTSWWNGLAVFYLERAT